VRVNGKEINKMRAAERCPEKAGVGGSSPSLATTIFNILQPLQNPISFRFIPKLWSVGIRLRNELGSLGRCLASPHLKLRGGGHCC